MNWQKHSVLVIFLALAQIGFCQVPVIKQSLAVTLAPTLLPNPTRGLGAEAALQYRTHRWAVNAEVALPFRKVYDDFSHVDFARWGAELQWFEKRNTDTRLYTGLRFNYIIRELTDTNGGTYQAKNRRGIFRYDQAFVSSPIFTAALKGGIEVWLSRRFFLNGSAGLGVRFIRTTYSDIVNPQPGQFRDPADCCAFRPTYAHEGRRTHLHLSGGLRLGYRIWRRLM